MRHLLVVVVAGLMAFSPITAQTSQKTAEGSADKVNRDPDAAQFITSNVPNFWKAYDLATPDDNLSVFKREYLKRGSIGLRDFSAKRCTVCDLVNTIEKNPAAGHERQSPRLRVMFSEPLAIFIFAKSLTERAWYGYRPFTKLFRASKYATKPYLDRIAELGTIRTNYEYEYPDYPGKNSGSILYLLQRDLVRSSSIEDFRSRARGTIPNEDLNKLVSILNDLTPVYRELVYAPNKAKFEQQLSDVNKLLASKDAVRFFAQGLRFYDSVWDTRDEIVLTFFPVPGAAGFTATAFSNIAISAVPAELTDYDGLLSVMFHEMFHIFSDEEPREVKRNLAIWFDHSQSRNAFYAKGLLEEALATALANGYVSAQLKGTLNSGNWYNNKYINLMAKQIYPTVKLYLENGQRIDKAFVDKYIDLYDANSPQLNTIDRILIGRDVLSDRDSDFQLLDRKFPFRVEGNDIPFSEAALKKALKTRITRVIIVTSDNEAKLKLIRDSVPELKDWQPDAKADFAQAVLLRDKAYLIIVNAVAKGVDELLNSVKL